MRGLLFLFLTVVNVSQAWGSAFLTIVDEQRQPVAGATILIGFEDGNPFPGNMLTTNATGQAAVPSDWKAALPLTVMATGFVTSTVPLALPGAQILELSHQEANLEIEIAGITSGFGRLREDGKVDFGLVMPALSPSSMLNFDLASVMSPYMDTIEIVGRSLEIPSNITLPDQIESYILPIRFNKPQFRSYVREPGQYRLTATHGQFPLQRVVNDIRAGKSMFEVINHFNFIETGSVPVTVNENVSGVQLPVDQTRFSGQIDVTAPAITKDQVIISLGLAEIDGLMSPTDLKRLKSQESLRLKKMESAPATVISLLIKDNSKKKSMASWFYEVLSMRSILAPSNEVTPDPEGKSENYNQMSFHMQAATSTIRPEFLPLLDLPVVEEHVLRVSVPTLSEGMQPVAMYWVLSEIEKIGNGDMKSERRTRLWEVWSSSWNPMIELPRINPTRRPDRTYRWEVLFMAQKTTFAENAANAQDVDLSRVTNITRHAVDL